MGFSPDRKTLLAVSIGSNSVSYLDTATNTVRRTTYVGRSPHEAFFTPDGREVWVSVAARTTSRSSTRGPARRRAGSRCRNGPGMTIFSPDGRYGYVCSSFSPETVAIDVKSPRDRRADQAGEPVLPRHRGDARRQAGVVHPQGRRPRPGVRGHAAVQGAQDHRDRTDHQPRQHRAHEGWAVRLRDDRRPEPSEGVPHRDFSQVATIPTGALPHGLWPSGDGFADLCRP